MLTEYDLRVLRTQAMSAHSTWKQEILLCDEIKAGRWRIMWPDLTVESSEPLVENIYAQALEDKTITAGAIPLSLFSPPTRGTRNDRGELSAQRRRRVGLSYWDRSNLRKMRQRLYRDWYHTGVMCGNPWATGFVDSRGLARPPGERFAYFETVNPRHLYPLGWNNRGELVAGMLIRRRRIADMKADWGETHPAVLAAEFRHNRKPQTQLLWLEEIWYFDTTTWAVAVGDASIDARWQGATFGPADAQGSMIIDWLVAPSHHRLGACPLKAVARTTHDDSPQGALVDIIPALKTAQNFMARVLDDLNQSIYAATVLEHIENPDEYGLGSVLIGDGTGKADIIRDRPPVNFEAQQTVNAILDAARRDAFEPAQRSGEAGASIISGKGTYSLMGTFNAELAAAQEDCEQIVEELTSATAAFDERWCYGRKEVFMRDMSTEISDETYDPAQVFKGDHRFVVSYGDRTGMDEQQHLTKLALVKNMGGMALRTFMAKSGMVDDPLAEETEITIEKLVTLWTDMLLPQEIQAGNKDIMLEFIEKIDTDKMTARAAMFEVIRGKQEIASAEQPSPGSPQGRADIMKLVRSLGAGGIPGQAEGQPQTLLPGADRRLLAQGAPGGTAT